MSAEFDFMSAREIARRIARREVSSVEVTRRALDKAAATQASINAFSCIMPDAALDAARAADAATMRGDRLGPLHGVPYSAKDLIAVKGAPMTFGSRTMATNVATADAPVVERMNAAGAILIGKTTTSEFGCKAVGDNPLNGITRNPWNTGKTPGGSSAGAGASVAAGVTPLALGTDGGGSIRIPCCLTGLAGLKAQFGRIPLWPHSAAPSVAHVGPMTRDIRDDRRAHVQRVVKVRPDGRRDEDLGIDDALCGGIGDVVASDPSEVLGRTQRLGDLREEEQELAEGLEGVGPCRVRSLAQLYAVLRRERPKGLRAHRPLEVAVQLDFRERREIETYHLDGPSTPVL